MTERKLTRHDRCDRCGAEAFVRVLVDEFELLFCGHHYAKHQEALASVCSELYDYRHLLNTKPSPSANV